MVVRRGWIACVLAMACGPDAPGQPAEGSSTSAGNDDGSAGEVGETSSDGPLDTGAVETTGVEPTTESSTGESPPGCEMPGACDECMQWETIVEGGVPMSIEHVAIAPDGTIVTAVAVEGPAPDNLLLRAFDAAGNESFEQPIDGDDGVDLATFEALEVADDGSIAVLWSQRVGEFERVTTIDVRMPDGSNGWVKVLGDETHSTTGYDLAFADDGSVVVVGGTNDSPVSYAGFASAHRADGEVVWELDDSALGVDFGSVTHIVGAADGGFAVAGYTDSELWLGWIASDGTLEWTAVDIAGEGIDHGAEDIAMSFDGEILVVGSEYSGGQWPVPWLGRFAQGGRRVQSLAYPVVADGPHYIDAIEVADDGRIFVAGARSNSRTSMSRFVHELDCDGAIVWEWTHVNPSNYDFANGGGLAWSPTVGLVAGGSDYLGEDDEFRKRGFLALFSP